MKTCNQSVLVALSGGVDSSVCVRLLQEEGYQVQAVVIDFSPAHRPVVAQAQQMADFLQIPLHVVSCHEAFQANVIDPFAKAYLQGQTPNPCILCNPSTKFHFLLETADRLGIHWVATGHYAGLQRQEQGRTLLKKADCLERDQSYMLYRLSQEQLSRLLLPLQGLPKSRVRELAQEWGLPCAHAPDSQEICFLPDGNYPQYIEEHYGVSPQGPFISPEGTVCGTHKGILHYTVGQRKGLGIALGRPVFIRKMDPKTNTIYLADAGGEFSRELLLKDCCFIPFPQLEGPMEVTAKVRSMAKEAPASIFPTEDGVRVVFASPQRAPAPGQSCVFYQGDLVVGGGFIAENDL